MARSAPHPATARPAGQASIGPIASVVVPAYNAAATLDRAVLSVLAQTLGDLEVLVVDDGSSDDTAALAARLARTDPRVRLLPLADNRGVSAARNHAITHATGTWVALLDADDAYEPDRLHTLCRCGDAVGADLVADNLRLVASDGLIPLGRAFSAEQMALTQPVSADDFVCADDAGAGRRALGFIKPIMRRSFLHRHGITYPEDLRIGEDFFLYVACLLHGGRLHLVDEALYAYTVMRRTALSHQDREVIHANFRLATERLLDLARSRADHPAEAALRGRLAAIDRQQDYLTLRRALKSGRWLQAVGQFRRMSSRGEAVRMLARAARKRLPQRRWAGVSDDPAAATGTGPQSGGPR